MAGEVTGGSTSHCFVQDELWFLGPGQWYRTCWRHVVDIQGMAALGTSSDVSGSVLLSWHEKVSHRGLQGRDWPYMEIAKWKG